MNSPNESGQFTPEQVITPTMPVMSRSRFAEMIGVSEGVVAGWIARGYVPTYTIGKYTLINIALLNRMVLDKSFWT